MTPPFSVQTTTGFDRTFRKLVQQHPDLVNYYARVRPILATDPYNRTRAHPIKKLEGIPAGQGQYRIRAGRLRFRYDIASQIVYLKACSLRREDTYRR